MEKRITRNDDGVTVAAFSLWLRSSRPGERFVYHHGNLAADREHSYLLPSVGQYVHTFFEPMHEIGHIAYAAYEKGIVDLVQQRRDKENFDYIAIKRKSAKRK